MIYFRKLPNLMHELYMKTSLFLLYYNSILLFNNFIEYSDLVVIIREYFRRFCRLLKRKKMCKGEKGRSYRILSPFSLFSSSSPISFSSLWYSWWYYVTNFALSIGYSFVSIFMIFLFNYYEISNLLFVVI